MKEGSSSKTDNIGTPMIRQYLEIKKRYENAILLYRVGDFYETFFDDAKLASKLLNIALTSRGETQSGEKIPLAGVPYHALNYYLYKLVSAGHSVAICEQTENPKYAKGVVKRDVLRVVTPGTLIDERVIDGKSNNNILAYTEDGTFMYYAFCDISTGEFHFSETEKDPFFRKFLSDVIRIAPKEIIVSEDTYREYFEGKKCALAEIKKILEKTAVNRVDDWKTFLKFNEEVLKGHLGINELRASGFEHSGEIISSGMLLTYLKETQKSDLAHIKRIKPQRHLGYMFLDLYTELNLDLLPDGTNRNANLFDIMDMTSTAMGGRLLKKRIMQPLLDTGEINERLIFVEELINADSFEIERILKDMKDIERIAAKASLNIIKPSELNVLKEALSVSDDFSGFFKDAGSGIGSELKELLQKNMGLLNDFAALVNKAISDEPPALISDTGIFKDAYDAKLDELRNLKKNGKSVIKEHLEEIKNSLGGANIKVGFNKILGYYFEVSRAKMKDMELPPDIVRKQTLVSSERFITEKLKTIEEDLLSVEEKLSERESLLWTEFLEKIKPFFPAVMEYASVIAELDFFISLKNIAKTYRYTKPKVTDSGMIAINGGRHPVIERQSLSEPFIPNDVIIDASRSIQIITGPNMSGKSTFLRQTALIVLMAQMGSFIPAESAEIGVVDRIFTRIGASDNLALGQSTFMVEMNEVANILNSCTDRSLILLDEIGRGTSTYDGLSLAWAVLEYLHDTEGQKAKTLFATHYHEISRITEYLERAEIYKVEVREFGDKIVFLRKVIKGSIDKSYGIYVAELAGIPPAVVERAKEILAELEEQKGTARISRRIRFVQDKLFAKPQLDLSERKALEMMKNVDINAITPMEALKILNEISGILKNRHHDKKP